MVSRFLNENYCIVTIHKSGRIFKAFDISSAIRHTLVNQVHNAIIYLIVYLYANNCYIFIFLPMHIRFVGLVELLWCSHFKNTFWHTWIKKMQTTSKHLHKYIKVGAAPRENCKKLIVLLNHYHLWVHFKLHETKGFKSYYG